MQKVRTYLLVLALVGGATVLHARNFVTGSRMQRLSAKEWCNDRKPSLKRKAVLVEFFSSANPSVLAHVEHLELIASANAELLETVVIAREPAEVMERIFPVGNRCFVAIDADGSLFDRYGVRTVPCTVLLDRRGRVVWSGDPATLTDERIGRATGGRRELRRVRKADRQRYRETIGKTQ